LIDVVVKSWMLIQCRCFS